MSLHTRSVAELGKGLQNRQFSSVELTGALLERVRASHHAIGVPINNSRKVTTVASRSVSQMAPRSASLNPMCDQRQTP